MDYNNVMNLFKFYRLDFCIRNLGLGIVAIFSLNFIPEFPKFLSPILQILLVQMHSFSMNNYFDFKVWGERNYVHRLLKKGVSEKLVIFLCVVPFLLLMLTLPFSNEYFWLLVLHVILFFFYHTPKMRFKSHYISSIVINSVSIGVILYIYPYLFLADRITLKAVIFSVIFFFYLGFHEIIHQIAHMDKDKIYSLPEKIGIEGAVKIAVLFLLLPIILTSFIIIRHPFKYFFFTGTIIFSIFRIRKLNRLEPLQKNFINLRNRKDKFYSFQEGIYYIMFLSLRYFMVNFC